MPISKQTGLRLATIFATMFWTLVTNQPATAESDAAERLRQGETILSTEGKKSEHFVKAQVLIHATPEIVWDTVHTERQQDPDIAFSKVLKKENNQSTLEQKFVLLPIFGTATCIMLDEEIPLHKITYKLLKSDHFKAMEGSWILTSTDDGRSTILALSSHLDLGFFVPQGMMDSVTGRKMDKRLQHIREMSETQARVAHSTSPI